ncbi:aspartyl protease family protein [Oceanicaulis sp.]|uniref:aspartyl protease family protein n=1 Tax=Oceanicaulis sp. TaxID=1924941 RepID=UPI003F6FB1D9
MITFQSLVVLALTLMTGANAFAQDPVTVPMERNSYGLFTVETDVGRSVLFSGDPEADPVPFIIDTGASHTAAPRLIAQQLSEQQVISLDRVGHGMTGRFDTDLIFVEHLDYGLGPRVIEVAVFEEAFGSVMTAAGLLGANAFTTEVIRLDFTEGLLELLPDDTELQAGPLSLQNGLVMGVGQMRGVESPVRVFIDTGASASIVNTALANARGRTRSSGPVSIEGVSGGTQAQGEIRRLFSRFRVDDFCMGLFEITVSDLYAFDHRGWLDEPAIILGMDVLQYAAISIDYGSGRVRLQGFDGKACPTARTHASLSPR